MEKFLEKYGDEFIQDRSREHLLFSQHKGGWLKRIALPAAAAAAEYSLDVAVSGGKIKTYVQTPVLSKEQAGRLDRAKAAAANRKQPAVAAV